MDETTVLLNIETNEWKSDLFFFPDGRETSRSNRANDGLSTRIDGFDDDY